MELIGIALLLMIFLILKEHASKSLNQLNYIPARDEWIFKLWQWHNRTETEPIHMYLMKDQAIISPEAQQYIKEMARSNKPIPGNSPFSHYPSIWGNLTVVISPFLPTEVKITLP